MAQLANPRGFAVELYFDQKLEARVFSFRKTIYELGITPILGALGDKPHVSLAVFSKADPAKLKQIADSLAQTLEPFPVQLEAVGTFPTPDNVLFLTPIPTKQLLKIHHQFHQYLQDESIESSEYYLPDRWVPHCTIEINLPDEQLDRAIQHCRQQFIR
jgi:2'-5' RNA ligase